MQPEPDTRVLASANPPRIDEPKREPSGDREPAEEPTAAVHPRTGPAASDEGLLTLRRWVGRYELIHRIGHGGMASVYLGRAKGKAGFEKIVAVKLIHPHLADEAEFVGMFLDEARIVARIHHPHVVEMLDLGEDEGLYYMVMEFIEGGNLAALVRALGREQLPIAAILQLTADTLEGLGAAHELRDAEGRPFNLVHRDISPHNILITLDGWAKVGDFGIMKATGKASNTRTGELRGKLAYMSPEQARGGRIDHRSDLFALGVIMWELLTGRRLFACTSEAATLEKVIACEIPALAGEDHPELTEHPELLGGLQTLVERSLAREPHERFEDAGAMLVEVRRVLREMRDLSRGSAPEDPRASLAAPMNRFFRARVDYARAALRRTGEHASIQGVAPEPLPRSESGPMTMLEPSLARAETLVPGRAPTGSNPALAGTPAGAGTGSNPTIVVAPRSSSLVQWLVLPMIGAAIAVVAMLVLDPLGRERELDVREPTPVQQPEQPSPSPASLASRDVHPPPAHAADEVRWCFSTTPTGARVSIAGVEQAGITPTCALVDKGDEALVVELSLVGYEPLRLDLTPVADQNFPERLTKLEPIASTAVRSRLGKPKSINPSRGSTPELPTKPGSEQSKTEGTRDDKEFIPLPASLLDGSGDPQ